MKKRFCNPTFWARNDITLCGMRKFLQTKFSVANEKYFIIDTGPTLSSFTWIRAGGNKVNF